MTDNTSDVIKILYTVYRRERNQFEIRDDHGFAIPQILVLIIGLSIALTGLIAASVNRLSSSRLSSLELQAKSSTSSGVATIRSLFNNTKGAYYYFWLAKSCSSNANNNECPQFGVASSSLWPGPFIKGSLPDLSRLYWADTGNKWCDGISSKQCPGRQVAPKCTYLGKAPSSPINWQYYRNSLSSFLRGNDQPISKTFTGLSRQHIQSFSLKSTDFIGSEDGGENSLLIEGYTKADANNNIKSSTNKLRANIGVYKIVSPQAFAFISASENQRDSQSLYLGNLYVSGDKQGSIIWRRNVDNASDCIRTKTKIGIVSPSSQLPDNSRGNGGVWVQPIKLPAQPKISKKNMHDLGPVVCTQLTRLNRPTTFNSWHCHYFERDGWYKYKSQDRVIEVDDLISSGKDAYFGIVTSDKSRVTLIVRGSIDLSNGGRICHRNNSPAASCGSGKPENLTIIFEQPGQNTLGSIANSNGKKELICSTKGGIKLRDQKNIPYNSFILNNSGHRDQKHEPLSAFIYGTDTTLTTATSPAKYYQVPRTGSKLLVRVRGLYGYINDPDSQVKQNLTPRLIRSWNGQPMPFVTDSGFNSQTWYPLVAVGTRSQSSNPGENTMLNMALIWRESDNTYHLVGMDIQGNQAQFVSTNKNGRLWYKYLGTDPFLKGRNNRTWLSYYGIDLKPFKNTDVYVKGAAWMKNLCLNQFGKGKVFWDFDKDFSENLVKRYSNNQYNYGVPYYRGKSIKVWDTLRDFYQ
tara:strand:+ start:6655 stop:8895 length:2241 start_codon:yes stop_codon:yes gene_type:complete